MKEYLVPTGYGEASFVEKRSKFQGRVWLTQTEEEALACIKQMREQHWDATHNVYAYIIEGGAMRYSDDGEPQGTAGMPVLEVLRREGVSNVCCVVTRYFGGILLGAGGLVRAYAKSAKVALDAAGLSMKRVWCSLMLACPYAMFERMKLETASYEGIIRDIQYGADITLEILVPQSVCESFCERIVDVSNGKTEAIVTGEEYRAFPVKPPAAVEEK